MKKYIEQNIKKNTITKKFINCEFDNQYTFGNKQIHLQSKKHIDYQIHN